jgi:hypothetical protein
MVATLPQKLPAVLNKSVFDRNDPNPLMLALSIVLNLLVDMQEAGKIHARLPADLMADHVFGSRRVASAELKHSGKYTHQSIRIRNAIRYRRRRIAMANLEKI